MGDGISVLGFLRRRWVRFEFASTLARVENEVLKFEQMKIEVPLIFNSKKFQHELFNLTANDAFVIHHFCLGLGLIVCHSNRYGVKRAIS